GRSGRGISLGERQRLALARAVLSPAPLVVLDEPTAHLDGATEQVVLDLIAALRAAGRTVVVIAHRSALVDIADDVASVQPERAEALRRAVRALEIPRTRLLAAVLAACATLGSAFALAAVSAYLVTRAWTMPPVLDLTVAVVAVRALGVSRGAFRWLERMLTHDVAL